MIRISVTRLVLCVLPLLFTPILWPQATTSLGGQVLDQSGAAIAGATVTITSLSTGATRSASTRGSGEYEFSQLPSGRYTLTVGAPGFAATKDPPLRIAGEPAGHH